MGYGAVLDDQTETLVRTSAHTTRDKQWHVDEPSMEHVAGTVTSAFTGGEN